MALELWNNPIIKTADRLEIAVSEIERLRAEHAALRGYLQTHAPLTLRAFNTTNLTVD